MKKRADPDSIRIRNGWPFLTADVADVAMVFRAPGGPSACIELRVWHQTRRAKAIEAAKRAGDDALPIDDRNAAMAEAAAILEAAHGYAIVRCWSDPSIELEARTGLDAGEFKGPDAKEQAGRAAVDELVRWGCGWNEIGALADALMLAITTREPTRQQQMEVRVFTGPPAASTT